MGKTQNLDQALVQRNSDTTTRFYNRFGTALGLALVLPLLWAGGMDAFGQTINPQLRGPDLGLDQGTADPNLTDPALDPLLNPKPAASLKPKPAPKLPDLVAYPSYPPSAAAERAKRRLNGPANTLATTGLPSLPNAAGAPKRITKYDPNSAPPPAAAINPRPIPAKPPMQALGPYDPVGVNVGGLRLNPYVESDGGYESNPANIPSPVKGSSFLRSEIGTSFKSDWTRHALSGELRGGYTDFFTAHESNHPDIAFTAAGRIDVTRDTEINLETHYNFTTQRNSATDAFGTKASRASGTATYGAAAGVTERIGRASLTLRGSLDRNTFDDVTLSDGTTLALHDGNYNTYELRGRAAYEITPGFAPYMQASVDTRKYDNVTDVSGYERDSVGGSLRLGTTYELSRIVITDINFGYGHRTYQDIRLKDVSGPVAEASLVWQATPLTKFTGKGSMSLDETTLAGASGIVNSKISGQVEHALLRNLTLTGLLSYQYSHYSCNCRNDQIFAGSIGANYNLTRELVLKGSYAHNRQFSTDKTAIFTDNIFMVGLRLQR